MIKVTNHPLNQLTIEQLKELLVSEGLTNLGHASNPLQLFYILRIVDSSGVETIDCSTEEELPHYLNECIADETKPEFSDSELDELMIYACTWGQLYSTISELSSTLGGHLDTFMLSVEEQLNEH